MRVQGVSLMVLVGVLTTAGGCLALEEQPVECFENADCSGTDFCGRGNECASFCSTYSNDCLDGDFCVDNRCEPEPECQANRDCPGSEFCVAGNVCDDFCIDNADCLPGDYCVDLDCQPNPECARNRDCPYGPCVDGVCE